MELLPKRELDCAKARHWTQQKRTRSLHSPIVRTEDAHQLGESVPATNLEAQAEVVQKAHLYGRRDARTAGGKNMLDCYMQLQGRETASL